MIGPLRRSREERPVFKSNAVRSCVELPEIERLMAEGTRSPKA
jgi:hypothetical protein